MCAIQKQINVNALLKPTVLLVKFAYLTSAQHALLLPNVKDNMKG